MSQLSTYRCDRCQAELQASTARSRLYVLGAEERLPVRAELAWCNACTTVVAKEVLPELSHVVHLLQELETHGPTLSDLEGAKSFGENLAQFVIRRKRWMQLMIAWLQGRSSPPRCLKCGSIDAARLPGDDERGPREFPHAVCGGTLRLVARTNFQDSTIELFTPEGLAIVAEGEQLLVAILAYFRRAVSNPGSVPPWSEWWAENEKHASQAFSLVDYVRLKHRKLTGARQILQQRGELPKDFVSPSGRVTGTCEKCGERLVERREGNQEMLRCPQCGSAT